MSVWRVEGNAVAGPGVKQVSRSRPVRHLADDEVPFAVIVRQVGHRIGAAADDARQVQQGILTGEEARRRAGAEPEFAHVMGQVVMGYESTLPVTVDEHFMELGRN